jgi:hypothetical protein
MRYHISKCLWKIGNNKLLLFPSHVVGGCVFLTPPCGLPLTWGEKEINSPLQEGWQIQICRLVFFFLTPPCGHPSLRGKRDKFPSTEGWQIQICRLVFFLSPRPTGTPRTRGKRDKFPSTRGVACEAMTGCFLSHPAPPYRLPLAEGNLLSNWTCTPKEYIND